MKIILRQKRRAADSIHFYNVLIRKIAHILGMVQMNRNYFNPNSPIQLPAEKYIAILNVLHNNILNIVLLTDWKSGRVT